MKQDCMGKGTIIFYGIPAYGHIYANLYFTSCLKKCGFRILYYAMKPFQKAIEANNCEYRAYPLEEKEIDLSDGKKLLKLYHLILKYTKNMLPILFAEAKKEKPCAIIFDSLALWGRVIGNLLSITSFSFYSIAAIDRIGGKGFMLYASGFSSDFLRYIGEIPKIVQIRWQLKQKYGIMKLGMLSVLMNKGDYNLMGYSRKFQPGGIEFGENYKFLGPVSFYRKVTEVNTFVCPKKPIIYISLGTIFNQDYKLLWEILKQFGRGEGLFYHIIMVWDIEQAGKNINNIKKILEHLKNFIVCPFVNQSEIMKQTDLFITSGGMNSIHEALYYKVPCLICPQQGEQLLNAKRFEALGFGKILKSSKNLLEEAKQTIKLKESWNEKRRKTMVALHMKETLKLFQKLAILSDYKQQGNKSRERGIDNGERY